MLSRALRVALVAAVTTAAAGACGVTVDNKPMRFFQVHNETAEPIVVFVEGPRLRGEVPPGQAWFANVSGCQETAVVATDPAGREIARLPRMCQADVWTFAAGGRVTLSSLTGRPGPGGTTPPLGSRTPYPGWWTPSPTGTR